VSELPVLEDLRLERAAFNTRARGFDLFRATSIIGRVSGEPVEPDALRGQALVFADAVRATAEEGAAFEERLDALLQVLFVDEGFRGNHKRYHDPANSYLHRVFETRRGIPLSLALVTLEVARLAGLPGYGIAFPGHFLVGFEKETEQGVPQLVIVDPFHRGRILGPRDLGGLLNQLFGGKITLAPHHVAPAAPRDVLVRMLLNLRGIFQRQRDSRMLIRVLNRLLLLRPEAADHYTERAVLLREVGETEAALSDALEALQLLGNSPEENARAKKLASLMDLGSRYVH
jgi:regulator of sirC expression with transglutaminase-like and TPR domain